MRSETTTSGGNAIVRPPDRRPGRTEDERDRGNRPGPGEPGTRLLSRRDVVFLALVVWVFARTYFFKLWFGTPVLLHVHGAAMSGWVVLLAIQSGLVAARRVQWHRRLGVLAACWAVLVVVTGSVTTVHAAAAPTGTSG